MLNFLILFALIHKDSTLSGMTDSNHQTAQGEWTTRRLLEHLENQIPEDFRLDYKGSGGLPLPKFDGDTKNKKRQEIGKDATAFANSDGGVIIYGIDESKLSDGRSVPSGFDPVSLADISRDQLAQIIIANSEPTIVGVRVIPVQAPNQNDPSKVCFVVIVPQSDTAHMAKDGCYHFRNEATTSKMRDWQVRDAMNRKRTPSLEVTAKMYNIRKDHNPAVTIHIELTNTSSILIRHYAVRVCFPYEYFGQAVITDEDSVVMGQREDEGYLVVNRSNAQGSPLFPSQKIYWNVVYTLGTFAKPPATPPSIRNLEITAYADAMPPKFITQPFTPSTSF